MPQADVYFLVDFQNPEATTGTEYMVVQLDPTASLRKILDGLLLSRSQLVCDTSKKFPRFATLLEAKAESARLLAEMKAANPDHVSASDLYPGQANRILDHGKPEV